MPSCLASIHCRSSAPSRSKYSLFSIGCLPLVRPASAIDEQHFDVRGIAELPAAELAHAEHGKGAGFLVCQVGWSVELLQLGLAIRQAPFDDDFGQFSQGGGEIRQGCARLDDVFHVDPEQLAIFEPVQRLLPRLVGFGPGHQPIQFLPERRARLDEGRVPVVLQERQEVAVLATEKVFPEKIAGAEQSGE